MQDFQEIYKNTTDIYIFRIIDQLNFDSLIFKNSFPADNEENALINNSEENFQNNN